MPDAPTAAPAAPAPAAAPTPVAAPPPQPAVTGQRAELGGMTDSDAFSQLDSMIAEPAPAPAAAKESDEPPPVRDEDIEALKAARDADKPTPKQVPPKDAKDGKFVKAATLRENYDRLKSEFKALQEKHAKMEADAVERAKQPNNDAHYKELQARYEALQKQHEDRETELRFANFERSQEYKDRYEKPMIDAYQSGRSKVASLKVAERRNPDTDEVVQPARQGTAADFDAIMMAQDDDQAAQLAADLFGAKAPVVLYHREKVQELAQAKQKAIEDYRKQGGEREKLAMEAANRQREEASSLYQQSVNASKEQYKDWFKPVDGDDKGNSLLEQSEALVDLAYGTLDKDRFSKLPAKTQERISKGQFDHKAMVQLHAAIRNKAMGFDRLAFKHTEAMKKIKDLETKLAGYEGSEPGRGQGGGRPALPADDSMESVLAGMDKLATPL